MLAVSSLFEAGGTYGHAPAAGVGAGGGVAGILLCMGHDGWMNCQQCSFQAYSLLRLTGGDASAFEGIG